ncbi:MAG: YraN family protein [Clostridiales bacterium]|nr:YraN family protein [Clostridiales bacterium]
MKQYATGLEGENIAEEFLLAKGMTCLEKRFRGADGEIDLIMLDGETVVFVEVKSRPDSRKGMGLMAVTPAKQRRMAHAALAFLAKREWMNVPVRFDVIEISRSGVMHISNAFMPPAE